MAVYAGLGDCTDPVVAVAESDLESADRRVLAMLAAKGIDASLVVSAAGLALLRDYAVQVATALAAQRGAVEPDSPLWKKRDAARDAAKEWAALIDRESLGLAAAGTGTAGYASIPLGRA